MSPRICVAVGTLLVLSVCSADAFITTFRAAVYEHAVVLPPSRETPVSRTVALENMMKNLEIYRLQAEIAGSRVRGF